MDHSPVLSSAVPSRLRRRVAITGAGGFLGSHLVQSYLSDGVSVRAVVHSSTSATSGIGAAEGLEIVVRELRDPRALEGAFEDQDLVVHAAALTRAHGPDGGRLMTVANVEMTRNVIEACRKSGVPRLVHISSTAGMGISPDPHAPADERMQYNLEQLGLHYNTSKHASEVLALQASDGTLETVVANPGFVFGCHDGRYRGGEVITRVMKGSVIVCTGGGLSIVHVDDVVNGIRRVADHGRAGQRYILSGDNLSFRAIADIVCTSAGVRKTVLSVPDVMRDLLGIVANARSRARGASPNLMLTRRFAYQYYSSEKARSELGYQPRAFGAIVKDFLDGEKRAGP